MTTSFPALFFRSLNRDLYPPSNSRHPSSKIRVSKGESTQIARGHGQFFVFHLVAVFSAAET